MWLTYPVENDDIACFTFTPFRSDPINSTEVWLVETRNAVCAVLKSSLNPNLLLFCLLN